jgi:hypothetical protein
MKLQLNSVSGCMAHHANDLHMMRSYPFQRNTLYTKCKVNNFRLCSATLFHDCLTFQTLYTVIQIVVFWVVTP